MGFLERTIERARKDKKTIVLPESTDERVIRAAAIILEKDITNLIIVGNADKIKELVPDVDVSKAKVIDPETSELYEDFWKTFYEMRKSKGVTEERAKDLLKSPLYFGVMLVKKGFADGMVAGAANSTGDTLRPALQILKTAPGTKIVSAFFVMVVPDCEYGENGAFIFGDSGLVQDPNDEELAEIAISSAKSFKMLLEAEPKVAMLSYSSHGSARSVLTEKVVRATEIAKKKAPDVLLDGELQLDAAIDMAIGQSKAPDSDVAGKANVLIFPNLDGGNIGYKLVQRLAKAEAYGPITQGIAMPVNDLSRGCSVEDIVGVVAITAVQAEVL